METAEGRALLKRVILALYVLGFLVTVFSALQLVGVRAMLAKNETIETLNECFNPTTACGAEVERRQAEERQFFVNLIHDHRLRSEAGNDCLLDGAIALASGHPDPKGVYTECVNRISFGTPPASQPPPTPPPSGDGEQ